MSRGSAVHRGLGRLLGHRTRLSRDWYIARPLPIERDLLAVFPKRAHLTIFDIGACEAEDSVRYARTFPNSRVFAVEPVPANVERARETVRTYGAENVTILPFALAETAGEVVMHLSSGQPPGTAVGQDWDYGNKSSSLLPPGPGMGAIPWLRFEKTVTVEARTLDGVCTELGLERIDFIHLDVQGAELAVLAGGQRMLATVRALWLEVEAVPLYEGQPLKDDVAGYLSSRGFDLALDTVGKMSGDQLWVRRGQKRTGSR